MCLQEYIVILNVDHYGQHTEIAIKQNIENCPNDMTLIGTLSDVPFWWFDWIYMRQFWKDISMNTFHTFVSG
jgi:hypothetical protein